MTFGSFGVLLFVDANKIISKHKPLSSWSALIFKGANQNLWFNQRKKPISCMLYCLQYQRHALFYKLVSLRGKWKTCTDQILFVEILCIHFFCNPQLPLYIWGINCIFNHYLSGNKFWSKYWVNKRKLHVTKILGKSIQRDFLAQLKNLLGDKRLFPSCVGYVRKCRVGIISTKIIPPVLWRVSVICNLANYITCVSSSVSEIKTSPFPYSRFSYPLILKFED